MVGEVLEKVLIQGVSDPDASVRRVLGSLDRRYDSYLADADNLRYLFIALNDEQFQVLKNGEKTQEEEKEKRSKK